MGCLACPPWPERARGARRPRARPGDHQAARSRGQCGAARRGRGEGVARCGARPSSPSYRHPVSPAQFASRFGVPSAQRSAVSSFLTRGGLSLDSVSAAGDLYTVHGTTEAIGPCSRPASTATRPWARRSSRTPPHRSPGLARDRQHRRPEHPAALLDPGHAPRKAPAPAQPASAASRPGPVERLPTAGCSDRTGSAARDLR